MASAKSATLTSDTVRVADVNGLTNPRFEYQPQRVDHATQTDIPGAVSKTYTLTSPHDLPVVSRRRFLAQSVGREGLRSSAEVPTSDSPTLALHQRLSLPLVAAGRYDTLHPDLTHSGSGWRALVGRPRPPATTLPTGAPRPWRLPPSTRPDPRITLATHPSSHGEYHMAIRLTSRP